MTQLPDSQGARGDRPVEALTPWLYSLLGAALALYPLRVGLTAWLVRAHPQVAALAPTDTPPPHLMGPLLTVGCTSCLELAVWVAWYVLFLIWAYRCAANMRALNLPVEFSPAACVVGLLPVVNLVMGAVVMSDLVLASQGRAVRGVRVSPAALAWWGCMVVAVVLNLVVNAVTHPQLLDRSNLGVPLAAAQVVIGSAYLVLTLLLVRRVRRAIEEHTGPYDPVAHPAFEREPWDV